MNQERLNNLRLLNDYSPQNLNISDSSDFITNNFFAIHRTRLYLVLINYS